MRSLGDFVIAMIKRPINHPIDQPTCPATYLQVTRSLNRQIAGREARQ
jgi:hypothetical protein